jgi:hypothetical protein
VPPRRARRWRHRRAGRARCARADAGPPRPPPMSLRAVSGATPTGSTSRRRWRTGRRAPPDRTGQVIGCERRPRAEVDHPLARLEPAAQFVGVDGNGRGETRLERSREVEQRHVGVVGGVLGQTGEEPLDETILVVDGDTRLSVRSSAIVPAVRSPPPGRGTEAAEAVGRVDRDVVGSSSTSRRPERYCARVSSSVSASPRRSVRPDGAVQQRAAGEDRRGTPVRSLAT